MENKIAIEKLTGSNYEAWKFNAEMLLAREQLWKYVEDDPPNPVTVGWKEGDHRTRGTIALLVGAGQRRLIQKCKTTKETWKKLEDTFGKSSPTTVLSMLRRVMTLKFTEGEDIGQHLNEMCGAHLNPRHLVLRGKGRTRTLTDKSVECQPTECLVSVCSRVVKCQDS